MGTDVDEVSSQARGRDAKPKTPPRALVLMFAWSCSCGDGAGSVAVTWDAAQREGELHTCRAGRLRTEHVVVVRPAASA